MARVCLILPIDASTNLSPEWVARCRGGLEASGHEVDLLIAPEEGAAIPTALANIERVAYSSRRSGLAGAMMAGIERAAAEDQFLVVLDATRNYFPEDLGWMVEPLTNGLAELAVARRVKAFSKHASGVTRSERIHGASWRLWAARGIGIVSRPVLGVSDPFAGLVAIVPELARAVVGSYRPVGDRFAVDLLLRTRCRRVDVPVRVEGLGVPITPSVDDLRHMKRLADDRFGTISRLVQFCVVGASGMMIDLSSYALFQPLFSRTRLASRVTPLIGGSLDLAAAGALAIGIALTWNFTLNRRLTFNDARRGSVVRQFLTYALSNALGIALSFSLRLYLPAHVAFFQRHKLAAALVGIVTATGISFSMARWLVFGKPAGDAVEEEARAEGAMTRLRKTKSTVA